jgi:hypothetical protein
MEKMVLDTERVLVVCTRKYKERVDKRTGGAGYEGSLISVELVKDHGTIKFIPVLREDRWEDAVPRCLSGRNGVDMRDDALFETGLAELLHDLRSGAANSPPDTGRSPLPPAASLSQSALALDGADRVKNAIAELGRADQRYYRILYMRSAWGGQKNNNALLSALKSSIIWHRQHPWPVSIGMLESILKLGEDEPTDPYLRKIVRANSVGFELRMDHLQRYEYVEARRDCSVTIVETEDFHWFRPGQLMFDKAIGTVSDALRFCSRFYELLIGSNDCEIEMTWYGIQGLRLTVMEEQFIPRARTLLVSPRVCQHPDPVRSELVRAGPQLFRGYEMDFLRRTAGYLFGQFDFDPGDKLTQEVLESYHSGFHQGAAPLER